MDHPLAAPEALVRPWRLAALVAGAIAGVELLILLAIGGGALVSGLTDRLDLAARERVLAPAPDRITRPDKTKPPVTTTAKAGLPRARTVVRVLNGNGRTGAAAAAAERVRSRGYRIGFVGNAPSTDFVHSLVMFKPGFAGEAKRLGRDLGVRHIGPLDGMRPRDLGKAHVVFILGA